MNYVHGNVVSNKFDQQQGLLGKSVLESLLFALHQNSVCTNSSLLLDICGHPLTYL